MLFERLVQADALPSSWATICGRRARPTGAACRSDRAIAQAILDHAHPTVDARHAADSRSQGRRPGAAGGAGGSVIDSKPDFDVAIVGYGPVGAFAALLLAEAGLRVAILERSRDVVDAAARRRARRRVGARVPAHRARRRPWPPSCSRRASATRSASRTRSATALRDGDPAAGTDGLARHRRSSTSPSSRRCCASRSRASDRIEVRLGHEVDAHRADGRRRSRCARATRDGATSTLRAAFAIGCDGASSFVRDALGIGWQSLGYDQDWLVVDIVQGPGADLPLDDDAGLRSRRGSPPTCA